MPGGTAEVGVTLAGDAALTVPGPQGICPAGECAVWRSCCSGVPGEAGVVMSALHCKVLLGSGCCSCCLLSFCRSFLAFLAAAFAAACCSAAAACLLAASS